jgi:hypothetical protein
MEEECDTNTNYELGLVCIDTIKKNIYLVRGIDVCASFNKEIHNGIMPHLGCREKRSVAALLIRDI